MYFVKVKKARLDDVNIEIFGDAMVLAAEERLRLKIIGETMTMQGSLNVVLRPCKHLSIVLQSDETSPSQSSPVA